MHFNTVKLEKMKEKKVLNKNKNSHAQQQLTLVNPSCFK